MTPEERVAFLALVERCNALEETCKDLQARVQVLEGKKLKEEKAKRVIGYILRDGADPNRPWYCKEGWRRTYEEASRAPFSDEEAKRQRDRSDLRLAKVPVYQKSV